MNGKIINYNMLTYFLHFVRKTDIFYIFEDLNNRFLDRYKRAASMGIFCTGNLVRKISSKVLNDNLTPQSLHKKGVASHEQHRNPIKLLGEPCGDRTHDHLIKSPVEDDEEIGKKSIP